MNKHENKKILIIDDDPDFLWQLEDMLTKAKYKVLKASGKSQAEKILETDKPDAMIVDLMMEYDDDGFALCYIARKQCPTLPIILVTGAASQEGIEFDVSTKEERSWIKADVLLDKPIRAEQIMSELKKLLKK